jgi:hypothetical protein
MRAQVNTRFDCKHETVVEVDVDDDTEIPATVRGLGKCPNCRGEGNWIAISGVAPKAGGREVVLDSIHIMPM